MANGAQSQAPAQPDPSSNTPKNLFKTNKTPRVKRTVIIDLDDEEAEGSDQPRASAPPDPETEPFQPTTDRPSSLRPPASDLPSIESRAPAPNFDLSRQPDSVSESRDSPIKLSFSQHERNEPRQPFEAIGSDAACRDAYTPTITWSAQQRGKAFETWRYSVENMCAGSLCN